jgi:hypothetical protein
VTAQEPTQVTSRCNLLASVCHLSFYNRSVRVSFSQVQRVFVVEHCLASRLYVTCQNEFRDTFPDYPVPNRSTLSRLMNRFRDTRCLYDRNCSGRPYVLSDDSLHDIRQILLRSPRKQLRKLSIQSGLCCGSAHKATKMHKLKKPEEKKRLVYCKRFTRFIRRGRDILDKVYKARFHLSKCVNSQISRIFTAEIFITFMKRHCRNSIRLLQIRVKD